MADLPEAFEIIAQCSPHGTSAILTPDSIALRVANGCQALLTATSTSGLLRATHTLWQRSLLLNRISIFAFILFLLGSTPPTPPPVDEDQFLVSTLQEHSTPLPWVTINNHVILLDTDNAPATPRMRIKLSYVAQPKELKTGPRWVAHQVKPTTLLSLMSRWGLQPTPTYQALQAQIEHKFLLERLLPTPPKGQVLILRQGLVLTLR